MSTALPYGLRDIKIQSYADQEGTVLATGPGAIVDLPNAQTLSFEEAEDFEELRGDDRTVTVHGKGAVVEFEFESGGLPLDVLPKINGGTLTETGVEGAKKVKYTKRGSDVKPFFRIFGRVISDSGGDVHAVIYRCKLSDSFEGEFGDGEFFVTNGSGQGLPMLDETEDIIYDFIHNQTATPLATTAPVTP